MQLCKLLSDSGQPRVGFVRNGQVFLLDFSLGFGYSCLSDILHAPDPLKAIEELVDQGQTTFPVGSRHLLAPIDRQEVWAAGVTYKRSKVAREQESKGAASFYDKVYEAARPELFFKATADRVVRTGDMVRVRKDSRWSVPEPELALYISPDMRIVGYSIGNDMSARDIEGENPLYLPQAKVYNQSCALGPVVTLAAGMPARQLIHIDLRIERGAKIAFEGGTRLTEMARSLESLVDWLGIDNSFPHGVVLLTGTGIVPPDDFTLESGDKITIEVTGIGRLVNTVA
jgi:2-dehydro-3-deoxy-D-arabinonate dehydratase